MCVGFLPALCRTADAGRPSAPHPPPPQQERTPSADWHPQMVALKRSKFDNKNRTKNGKIVPMRGLLECPWARLRPPSMPSISSLILCWGSPRKGTKKRHKRFRDFTTNLGCGGTFPCSARAPRHTDRSERCPSPSRTGGKALGPRVEGSGGRPRSLRVCFRSGSFLCSSEP